MEAGKKIVLGIAIVALFGTVTNYVYLSPLLTLLLPLCIFVVNKDSLPRPVFWLYVFAAMFVLSTLLYDWHSLFSFEYYRRDGNFIISYAPLLVLPLFSFRFTLKKYIRYFYVFVVTLYSILFVYHTATIGGYTGFHSLVFGGPFYAQNAAGGFLAVAASLGFAYFYNRRTKKELFFFLILFVILTATYSRGSIVGLALGIIAWYATITKRYKTVVAIVAIPVLFTIGSLVIGYPNYKNTIESHNEAVNQFDNSVSGKKANVLVRVFYLFPQAYYIFLHSPVVGAGVGSFDDRPLEFKKVIPGVSYNAQPQKVHTDRHAHHSYLMILAEQGLLGLGIFLTFWITLFIYLMRIRGAPVMKDFLLIAYFTLTFAAFTEHRITTPSNMLPFTISLGLFFAQDEKISTYILQEHTVE